LTDRARRWNERYDQVATELRAIDGVRVPKRDPREQYVAYSIQFNVDYPDMAGFVADAASSGVALKWFGAEQPHGFTSRSDHWRYAPEHSVPNAAGVLGSLIDMGIPLAMSSAQSTDIAAVIADCLARSA
jgi:hypothetical protein